MRVSVILTVLNEGQAIRDVLESLLAQTRRPDEVVIVDGGSSDDTLSIVSEYGHRLPLRLISARGANISQGRNIAIRAATGDLIAVTDAGVRCEPTWLEKLTGPLTLNPSAPPAIGKEGEGAKEPAAVAGFFRSDPRTVLETAMGSAVLPEARDVNPRTYLPSSRSVAFRKDVWEAVGGYPEWLDFCEDVVFDLKVRERFGPFAFAPEAVVYFRPRGSLPALARQYYRYARGDGKANLFFKQHLVRYFAYLVAAPLLTYAALTLSPWLWLLGVGSGLVYLRTPLRRLWPHLKPMSWLDRARAVLYLPLIRLVGDVAKMAGYPVGAVWRMRNRNRTHGCVVS
jgi:glycosyltransferase involved in cell wall biosynthesis